MKHTKGEWMVSGGDQIVAMPSQVKVCNRISGASFEEMEANAKLIAAAPDLLEALIEAKRMYEDIQPIGGWQGVYEQIGSAIKKATK